MKKRFIGIILVIVGFVFIFDSFSNITGATIGSFTINNLIGLVGLVLFVLGIFLLLKDGIENKVIGSRVKDDSLILKIAEDIGSNERISNDINHLIEELNKGNTNPGLGTKSIHPGIFELKGRNGGRVYFRELEKSRYEILGYSDKKTQDKVIHRLRNLY